MKTDKTTPRPTSLWTALLRHMEGQVRRKRKAGKESTADQYRAVLNWLLKFTDAEGGRITELTTTVVEHFICFLNAQKHLCANSKKSYFCGFRAMYNRAVREGVKTSKRDPFAGILLQGEKPVKRAVTREAIEEIARLDLSNEPHLKLAADLCIGAYFASGMPFVDMVHLTTDNLQDGTIVYHRCKTGTLVRIGITEGLQNLIDTYHVPGSTYLFPVLPEGVCTHEGYKTCLRNYNTCLKEIGLQLSTPVHLTSYVIRHTWATEALRQHTPVAVISQALGHTSEKTTRCYLAELDQSELNEANAMITASVEKIMLARRAPLFAI